MKNNFKEKSLYEIVPERLLMTFNKEHKMHLDVGGFDWCHCKHYCQALEISTAPNPMSNLSLKRHFWFKSLFDKAYKLKKCFLQVAGGKKTYNIEYRKWMDDYFTSFHKTGLHNLTKGWSSRVIPLNLGFVSEVWYLSKLWSYYQEENQHSV